MRKKDPLTMFEIRNGSIHLQTMKLGTKHLSMKIVQQIPEVPLWDDTSNVVVFPQGLDWYNIQDNDGVGITESVATWESCYRCHSGISPKDFMSLEEDKGIFWADNPYCGQARLIKILGWVDTGKKDYIYSLYVRDKTLLKFKLPREKPYDFRGFTVEYLDLNEVSSIDIECFEGLYRTSGFTYYPIKDAIYTTYCPLSWFEERMFSNFLDQSYRLENQIYIL